MGNNRTLRQGLGEVHFLAYTLVACVLAVYFMPALLRPDVYTNDAAQHISWMYRYSNVSLFPHCPMQDYFGGAFTPIGFRFVYATLARFIDAQTCSELLAFPLAIISLFGAHRLGVTATSGSRIGGWTATGLALFGGLVGGPFNYMAPLAGGLQRSFAIPILVWGVIGALQRRAGLSGAMLLLAGLFYPPSCLLLGTLLVEIWIWDAARYYRLPEGTPWLAAAGIASAAVLWELHQRSLVFGPTLTFAEMAAVPDFYAGGINYTPILFHSFWGYVGAALPPNLPAMLMWSTSLLAAATLLRSEVPTEAWLVLAAGAILYVAAYGVLFTLYEPQRYTLYAALMFQLIALPVIVVVLGRKLAKHLRKLLPARFGIRIPKLNMAALAFLILAFCALAGVIVARRYETRQGGMTGELPESAYLYLRNTAVDTCIAAHPIDANYIPLRSQRCVTLVADALNIRQRDFRRQVMLQLRDILGLMYARNLAEIQRLKKRLNCSLFLINTDRYRTDPLADLAPTSTIISHLRSLNGGADPFLRHPPEQAIVFRDGPVTIIDLNRLPAQ